MGDDTKATVVERFDHDNLIDGSIRWDDEFGQMDFVCPCGCKKTGSITLKPWNHTGWTMTGTRDAPVLHPSVFFEQGRRGEWHGWLGGSDGSRPGEWVSC